MKKAKQLQGSSLFHTPPHPTPLPLLQDDGTLKISHNVTLKIEKK